MTGSAIVVPIGSPGGAAALLPVASTLAEHERGLLVVLRVGGRAPSASEILEGLAREALVRDARAGHPLRSILEAAREPGPSPIVVMPTQAEPSRRGRALGLGPAQLLLRVSCPVVLVHPDRAPGRWEMRHILLPHDGTPTTSAAINPVCNLASQSGARLSVLHAAAREGPRPQEPGSLQAPRYLDQPHHEWPAWSNEFLERFRSLCPLEQAKVHLWLGRGSPESEVVRFIRDRQVDLVVLAWGGVLEAERARVFQAIVRSAPCPVMVLRTEQVQGR